MKGIFFLLTSSILLLSSSSSSSASNPPITVVNMGPCLAKYYQLKKYIARLEFIDDYNQKYNEDGKYKGLNQLDKDFQTVWQSPYYVTSTMDFAETLGGESISTGQSYSEVVNLYSRVVKFESVIKDKLGEKAIVNCEVKYIDKSNLGTNPGFIYSCSATLLCKY